MDVTEATRTAEMRVVLSFILKKLNASELASRERE